MGFFVGIGVHVSLNTWLRTTATCFRRTMRACRSTCSTSTTAPLLDVSLEATEPLTLASVVEASRSTVVTEDAHLFIEYDGEIIADETRLKQLIENLFRNVLDHGGDDVTVRVGALTDGFVVEDGGPGIPAPERGTVFERGFSTATDGTGFGLSIVEEIVAAHGWEITAPDAETGVARFEITGVEMTPD